MSKTHSFVVSKPPDGIKTLDELSRHLQAAAYVELSTVPMYLYAAYSIKTRGYSQWATGHSAQRTLIAVAIEEMLHLALARNVLVAIGRGGDLTLYSEKSIPTYPGDMLHRVPPLSLGLQRISTKHVETFLGVEKPEPWAPQAAADDDVAYYRTLGEFYKYIENGIKFLSSGQAEPKDRIDWSEARNNLWKLQYKRAFWNQNGGAQKPQYVVDEASALAVLDVIVEQGEGAPHDKPHPDPIYPPSDSGKFEDSHYTKFQKIHDGVDGIGVIKPYGDQQVFTIDSDEVRWPVIDNPHTADVNESPVRGLMELSNAAYCYVLALLDKIYETPVTVPLKPASGDGAFTTDPRYGYERGFIAAMQGVLYPIADLLVRTPFKPGELKVTAPEGVHAGPPFEYYPFKTRTRSLAVRGSRKGPHTESFRDPKQDLVELCHELTRFYRELGGDDGVERQISLLPDFELPGAGKQG